MLNAIRKVSSADFVISQFEGQTEFTVVSRKKQLFRATSFSNTADLFGSHHNDSFKANFEVP